MNLYRDGYLEEEAKHAKRSADLARPEARHRHCLGRKRHHENWEVDHSRTLLLGLPDRRSRRTIRTVR